MRRPPTPDPDQTWYLDNHPDRDWMNHAQCRDHDPDLWFPEKQHDRHQRYSTRYATRAAQKICLECPVANECLTYALTTDTRWGIWAGTTAGDRARLTGRKATTR